MNLTVHSRAFIAPTSAGYVCRNYVCYCVHLVDIGTHYNRSLTMSQTVTLKLDDAVYQKFKGLAAHVNRPLSNFIQTAALRFVEEHEVVDEYEMAEIKA